MQDNEASVAPSLRRGPWNKGKLVGAKPPLRPKHVWSIRTKLQVADRKPERLGGRHADEQFNLCDLRDRSAHAGSKTRGPLSYRHQSARRWDFALTLT